MEHQPKGKIMGITYSQTIRKMQAATAGVDRSFSDVTEGFSVIAQDGTVLLPFTGSTSRATRLMQKHEGSKIVEVSR